MVKRMAMGEFICDVVVEDVFCFSCSLYCFRQEICFDCYWEDVCVFEITKKMGSR